MSSTAQPTNNLIFFGGSGDGHQQSSFSLAENPIFTGGAGDGFGQASNNRLSNAIFLGGEGDGVSAVANNAIANNIFSGSNGDGFTNGSNTVTPNSIFVGSAGDGFSFQSNNAVSNNIFAGSEGDGFSNSVNVSSSNNIFIGGEGDGWNAVILPLGPLPVKLLSFTAEHSGKAHLVKWITTEEINTHHFEVQRSSNGRDFISHGNLSPAGGPSAGAAYSYMVNQPWTGNNFYRLRIVDTDGSVTYSNIVLLKNVGDLQLSVYPNPTADVLYVRIPAGNNNTNCNAKLYDAQGKLVMQQSFKTGISNALQVSHLPAGIYTLHCLIGEQVFVCRFLRSGN